MPELMIPLSGKLNMATLGMMLGVILAVPVAFMAARNTTPLAAFLPPFVLFIIVASPFLAVYQLAHLGSLGLKLQASLNLLSWPQVTMILITVVISEWVSARVRTALI